MDILILIVAVWAGFFLLSLACAAVTNRSRAALGESTSVDFRIQPLLLPDDSERFKPLREIVTTQSDSPSNVSQFPASFRGAQSSFAKAQN